MTRKAFAKINLGLHILRRREDGFHDLETVFLRVGWFDELTFAPAASLAMTCSDPMLPVDASNLCMRAARLVADSRAEPLHVKEHFGAQIHLEKHLPYGAGLGSGSSDAAITLLACNELWDAGLRADELSSLAAQLGSDVAFFLEGPVAFGSGRGEVLTELAMPAALKGQWLSLVVPPVHVSTAEAYGGISPNDRSRPDLSSLVASGSLVDWRSSLVNDFEASIFGLYPVVQDIRDHLLRAGAGYAAMSGSGSSVFGVFESKSEAQSSLEALPAGCRTWVGRADAAV